jgi:hypothetical protein
VVNPLLIQAPSDSIAEVPTQVPPAAIGNVTLSLELFGITKAVEKDIVKRVSA